MNKVLNLIKDGDVCVEIGVWKGDFSSLISDKTSGGIYLVDPWESIGDIPNRWHAAPQNEMDDVFNGVVERFSGIHNIKIIKKFSSEACLDFDDESVNWIYVDGNHSYDFVKSDLEGWWPKLKPGGYLCGDDYQEGKYQVEELDFGVVKAVDEFRVNYSEEIKNFTTFKDQFVLEKK